MTGRRGRVCAFCREPMPADMPTRSRYCCRSHRQRAYEARASDETVQLRRRVRALRRQVAAYDAAIKRLAEQPGYGRQAADQLIQAYVPLPDEPGWDQRAWILNDL